MKRTTLIITAALLLSLLPMTAYADGTRRHYVEPQQEPQEAQAQAISADEFRFQGVVESNDRTWTWYSERVLPGDGLDALNANGRTVNGSGYVVDADGYIAVASPWGVDSIGTVIETPFGPAKVYDVCEGDSYDVYTSW